MVEPDAHTELVNTAGVPTLYVNHVGVRGSATDIALSLGVQVAGNDVSVQLVALMAWEQASIVHRLLESALADYAKEIGTVRDIATGGPVRVTGPTGQSESAQEADPGSEPADP